MIWCLKKQRLRNPCVVTRNRSYVWATLGFFIRTVRSARCCIFVPSGPRRIDRCRSLDELRCCLASPPYSYGRSEVRDFHQAKQLRWGGQINDDNHTEC